MVHYQMKYKMTHFVKIPLLRIPYDEQQEIADYLINENVKLNKMIDAIEREIALIEELRTRIIADVVTGQIDVRDVIIPDYDKETIDEEDEIDTDSEDSDEESEDEE